MMCGNMYVRSRSCSLSHTNVGDATGVALGKALEVNTGLHTLQYGGCWTRALSCVWVVMQ